MKISHPPKVGSERGLDLISKIAIAVVILACVAMCIAFPPMKEISSVTVATYNQRVIEGLDCRGWRVEERIGIVEMGNTDAYVFLYPPSEQQRLIQVDCSVPELTRLAATIFCILDPNQPTIWEAIESADGRQSDFLFFPDVEEAKVVVHAGDRKFVIEVGASLSTTCMGGLYRLSELWASHEFGVIDND